jgi:murein DD-endopeptidase MepM/ murein hydrolase activator NlpD
MTNLVTRLFDGIDSQLTPANTRSDVRLGRRDLLKSGGKLGLAAGALALLGNAATVQPAAAAAGSDHLKVWERLNPGQFLRSQNGAYVLIMQSDGNAVIYAPGNIALWSTGTRGNLFLNNEGDGRLVVHGLDYPYPPHWIRPATGSGPSTLVMQDDGNLVFYTDTNPRVATWQSGTMQGNAIQPTSGRVTGVMSNRCGSYDADHYGVDLGTGTSTPAIVATASGIVTVGSDRDRNGKLIGRGHYVIVRHNNGYSSHYFHLSRFAAGLASGQAIAKGALIGYVGSTGNSTGNHLHFGMQQNGAWVNLSSAYGCGQTITQGQPIRFSFPGI